MSALFDIENNKVTAKTGTLLIHPFKKIWGRERNKERVLQEFAYIEFMSSMTKDNPFKNYPEEMKHDVIKKAVIKDPKWKPDKLVKEGIEVFKRFYKEGSVTYGYYMASKEAIEKMQKFLHEVDLTAIDPKTGKPVYKPKEITSCLLDTERLLSNFEALGEKVNTELYDKTRTMANREISPFAEEKSFEKKENKN